MDSNVETIKKLKEKKEAIQIAKAKISAQLESHEQMRNEIVKQLSEEFGISVSEIESVLNKLVDEQDSKISAAEELLNKVNL